MRTWSIVTKKVKGIAPTIYSLHNIEKACSGIVNPAFIVYTCTGDKKALADRDPKEFLSK